MELEKNNNNINEKEKILPQKISRHIKILIGTKNKGKIEGAK